jgi:hypothetical protein
LVLLRQTVRFRTDLYDREQRLIEGLPVNVPGAATATAPVVQSVHLLTEEQSKRYTPEARRRLVADFIKTIGSLEAIQVSDRINKYVALKMPIVYFAIDGTLVITNLFWPRGELLDLFYVQFQEWKTTNPGSVNDFMNIFFVNLYKIWPSLSPIHQMAIGAQQSNIGNFMPSDVAVQDMKTRIDKTSELANKLRAFLETVSVNLNRQPGDSVEPFQILENLLRDKTSNTAAANRLVEIADTMRFYSTPERNVGGLLIPVPETSQDQMAEWERQTIFALNCITIISLIVVLFPSYICPDTAKDIIDYAKYVLGTTLFISFEQQIFDCIGTVLDLPRLIEIGQSVGTTAVAVGSVVGQGVFAFGNAAAGAAGATKEKLEAIIRMLISTTPEQISGPQDDRYYNRLQEMLAQDEEDRQYILGVAEELGVQHTYDPYFYGSQSPLSNTAVDMLEEGDKELRTMAEGLKGDSQIQSQSQGMKVASVFSGFSGLTRERSGSTDDLHDPYKSDPKRHGGGGKKTLKRKITKRRKSKQNKKRTRKQKKTSRRSKR